MFGSVCAVRTNALFEAWEPRTWLRHTPDYACLKSRSDTRIRQDAQRAENVGFTPLGARAARPQASGTLASTLEIQIALSLPYGQMRASRPRSQLCLSETGLINRPISPETPAAVSKTRALLWRIIAGGRLRRRRWQG